ncbi:MAG: hypothetical protein HYY06_22730, partial [Deltaproteobacteria bacterium]|nr:hypothetical protein [Deltaproteobacteria bacterium]
MFLSRFWYLVLATIAGASVGAYLIAVGQYNRARGEDLEALLIKDRVQVEAHLKLEARQRIDALQGIAVDETVRSTMATVFGHRTDEAARGARATLAPRLRALNEELEEVRGDFLAALDDHGKVVAQVGLLENVEGVGYGQFPIVQAALRGYLRDDVWRLDDKLYRVAARPIIQGGQYVGAILHGMEFGSPLAERLYRKAGVQAAFFLGPNVVASYAAPDAPMPTSGELGGPLVTILPSEQFQNDGRTQIIPIGANYSGIYSKITGEAAENDAGYVVSRPRVAIADPLGFALNVTTEATGTVPWPVLVGGVVLAFVIGLGLVFLERDRPLSKLRKGIASLAGRERDRLDITKLGGPYRKLATGINDAIDKAVEAAVSKAPPRREADLDAILGPTPGGAAPVSPFAFPSMEDGADLVPSAPPPAPSGGAGRPPAPAGPPRPPAPAPMPPPPMAAMAAPPAPRLVPPPPAPP